MTPAEVYRVKAGDMASLARAETDPVQKAEYEKLSLAYLRLAEQADRNSQNVVWYPDPMDRPPAQTQQQQAQPPASGSRTSARRAQSNATVAGRNIEAPWRIRMVNSHCWHVWMRVCVGAPASHRTVKAVA